MPIEQRDHALDDVRTLMVLAVVLLHAACAYAPSIPWWHARDTLGLGYDVLIFCFDVFALPVLYYLAGGFAAPSLERRGPAGFLRAKFLRLGLPVLVLSAFYMPAMVYVGYLGRAEAPLRFFGYWTRWMASLADWKPVLLADMQTAAPYRDAFSPHHMWFIVLLLAFFALFALRRAAFPARAPRPGAFTSRLWLTAAGIALGFALLNALVPDWAWARLGPLVLYQPTRVPLYAGMFVLGACARAGQGGRLTLPGPVWAWGTLFVAATLAILAASRTFMAVTGWGNLHLALAHGALRALAALGAVGLFTGAAVRLLSRPAGWRRSLAASSYHVYLLHMPLVVFAQAALVGAPLPPVAKMLLAFIIPALACWGMSRAIAARGAWLSAGSVAVFFAGAVLLY